MKARWIWAALFAVAVCVSCDRTGTALPDPDNGNGDGADYNVEAIEYTLFGNYKLSHIRANLLIMEDTISYEQSPSENRIRVATPASLWKKLCEQVHFETFSTIESSDFVTNELNHVFLVRTKTGEATVRNGYGEAYKQHAGLFDLLQEQMNLFQEEEDTEPVANPESKRDVESISYHCFGGMLGYDEQLTVTPDSLSFSLFYMAIADKALVPVRKELRKVTPDGLWDELLDKCDLSRFPKIKNGRSMVPVDGTDQIFTVRTKKKEYSVRNGYGAVFYMHYDFFSGMLEVLQAMSEEADTP
jgi:hypothetical protein